MSYDSDFPNTYMVEFFSGRVIYVGQFTVEEVIEYFNDEHEDEVIKSIMNTYQLEKKEKGFSFIQTAKLAESEGTLRASGMRPGSNPGPRAPKRVR